MEFYSLCKRFRPITFLGELFCIFFQRIQTQRRILRFMITILNFGKKYFFGLSSTFANLKPTADETAQKTKNVFYICIL
jgi:hypothetical protein